MLQQKSLFYRRKAVELQIVKITDLTYTLSQACNSLLIILRTIQIYRDILDTKSQTEKVAPFILLLMSCGQHYARAISS